MPRSAMAAALALFLAACGGSSNSTPPGPGANLKCASSGKNAWQTYGQNAFLAVNQSIFNNVTAELKANGTANLGNSFSKVGTGAPNSSTADGFPDFMGNLAAFLVYVYGGPTSIQFTNGKMYVGPQDMVQSHQGLAITDSQFQYFVAHAIVPALTSNGVPSADVSSCFAPPITTAAFENSVINH